MDQALRIRAEGESDVARSMAETAAEGIEKVLRFAMPAPRLVETEAPRPSAVAPAGIPITAREFAAAIDGVHEARQALKAADERTREAEMRTHTLAQRAAEELRGAEARIQALEARIRGAESRAEEAETRAAEADAWLRQIFSTIAQELPARRPA